MSADEALRPILSNPYGLKSLILVNSGSNDDGEFLDLQMTILSVTGRFGQSA